MSDAPHPILVERGAFARAGALLGPYARGGRLVVVTDENVRAAQGARFAAGLAAAGIAADWIALPAGEGSKDWPQLIALTDQLFARGIERRDHVVALGGGVVGDLAGFAAAIVKRGCGIVQVPTSLLAMVDSAIGGKTGINADAGKNMVGAFHQPALVLVDPDCLDTLPQRELRAGYAEAVKYGLIGDAAFFAWCERHGRALLDGDGEARLHAIRTCAAAKAAIVAEDPQERTGRRALLNLGHTCGHALEAETGFSDRLRHGEAVAVGMVLAFRFAAARGLCPPEDAERVAAHLRTVGLPTSIAETGVDAPAARLAAWMRRDKKAEGGLALVLPRRIGEVVLDRSASMAELAAFLDACRG